MITLREYASAQMENVRFAARKTRRGLRQLFHRYHDNDPDPGKTVFLCGAPRSGTTWLAEVLNYNNDYRFLYEPFNCKTVPLCRHFYLTQYVRPEDNNPAYLEPAKAIMSGQVRDAWIDQHNRRKNVQRRLIKDVRSNLMLKWIRNHFPRTPIIFLMRHPCAVAVSRMKLGWPTDFLERVFLAQENLVADYLSPFVPKIASADSAFERHIVDWCIEHLVPLAQLEENDVCLAFYENLVLDPKKELRRIFGFLRRAFDESALHKLDKPSATSRTKVERTAIPSGTNVIDGWRDHVSASQLLAATQLTQLFGLDHIYGDTMPNVGHAPFLEGISRGVNLQTT